MKTEKASAQERAVLLKRRDDLVAEVQELKTKAPGLREPSYVHRFYDEDLKERARKILAIDRKLGRG